jgi:hypothetical protein
VAGPQRLPGGAAIAAAVGLGSSRPSREWLALVSYQSWRLAKIVAFVDVGGMARHRRQAFSAGLDRKAVAAGVVSFGLLIMVVWPQQPYLPQSQLSTKCQPL